MFPRNGIVEMTLIARVTATTKTPTTRTPTTKTPTARTPTPIARATTRLHATSSNTKVKMSSTTLNMLAFKLPTKNEQEEQTRL